MTTSFFQQIKHFSDKLPPVEQWSPPLSGKMDCVIKSNGDWWLDGAPLERTPLVRLYSTVLKKEAEEYFLVTPVEKWQISVEDLPFMIVEISVENCGQDNQLIKARTNVGDWVSIDEQHPLASSKIANSADSISIPYAHIRQGLCARFNRSSYHDLAKYLQPQAQNSERFYLQSAGRPFLL